MPIEVISSFAAAVELFLARICIRLGFWHGETWHAVGEKLMYLAHGVKPAGDWMRPSQPCVLLLSTSLILGDVIIIGVRYGKHHLGLKILACSFTWIIPQIIYVFFLLLHFSAITFISNQMYRSHRFTLKLGIELYLVSDSHCIVLFLWIQQSSSMSVKMLRPP